MWQWTGCSSFGDCLKMHKFQGFALSSKETLRWFVDFRVNLNVNGVRIIQINENRTRGVFWLTSFILLFVSPYPCLYVYSLINALFIVIHVICSENRLVFPSCRVFLLADEIIGLIIQQTVTMPIYGKEALNICHPTWQISCDIRKWPYLEVHCRFSFIVCLAAI